MQNTYATTVNKIVEEIANNISSAAFDSVEENALYIEDSTAMLQFVLSNYTTANSTFALASAALDSTLDTVVRENLYTLIKNI